MQIKPRNNLYVILDKTVFDKKKLNLVSAAKALSKLNIDIFQIRFAKTEKDREIFDIICRVVKIIKKQKKIVIINNRLDFAFLSKADGIHLGAGDLSVFNARNILGKNKIIGVTCHSLKELRTMSKLKDVNYLSIGPIFRTKTKPKLNSLGTKNLPHFFRITKKPLFAIGGITSKNVHLVKKSGISNIAVTRSIILSKNPQETIEKLRS